MKRRWQNKKVLKYFKQLKELKLKNWMIFIWKNFVKKKKNLKGNLNSYNKMKSSQIKSCLFYIWNLKAEKKIVNRQKKSHIQKNIKNKYFIYWVDAFLIKTNKKK